MSLAFFVAVPLDCPDRAAILPSLFELWHSRGNVRRNMMLWSALCQYMSLHMLHTLHQKSHLWIVCYIFLDFYGYLVFTLTWSWWVSVLRIPSSPGTNVGTVLGGNLRPTAQGNHWNNRLFPEVWILLIGPASAVVIRLQSCQMEVDRFIRLAN